MDLNQLIKKYSYQKEKICSLHQIFVNHCFLLTGNIFHNSNFLRIPKPVYLHLHIDLCCSWSMRLLAISAAHRTTCQNREKKAFTKEIFMKELTHNCRDTSTSAITLSISVHKYIQVSLIKAKLSLKILTFNTMFHCIGDSSKLLC